MAGVRMHVKDTIHFITNRCEQEQFLMLPSATINQIIGYWFARALEKFGQGLEIFAFIFLSNHFHLLARDTQGTLARFMCYFQGNVAKAVNRELGRRGKFFAREYDDVIVDGDEEFLDRYAYVLGNAVKAGLVYASGQWIGLSSLAAALSGEKLSFEMVNATRLHNATRRGQKVDVRDFLETYEIELALPPMWEGKTIEERRELTLELLESAEAKYHNDRGNAPVLGIEKVLEQRPTDRPKEPAFRPRIKVYSHSKERRKELLDAYRTFNWSYKEIWGGFKKAALRGRRPMVEWPMWSYPPSLMTPVGYELAA